MNTLRAIFFLLFVVSTAFAKHLSHEIVADVESVSISDNKILLILNGTIQLTMYSPTFSGGNPSAYERPVTKDLDKKALFCLLFELSDK